MAVKRSEEKNGRRASVRCPSSAGLLFGFLALIFSVGLAWGLGRYTALYSHLKSSSKLILAVPPFAAGSNAYILIKRETSKHCGLPEISITDRSGKVLARKKASKKKVCVLPLPLRGEGQKSVTVRAGNLFSNLHLQAKGKAFVDLWAGVRFKNGTLYIEALLLVRSFPEGKALCKAPVTFQLLSPKGNLIAREQSLSDENGVCVWSVHVRNASPGKWKIRGKTPFGTVAADLAADSGKKVKALAPAVAGEASKEAQPFRGLKQGAFRLSSYLEAPHPGNNLSLRITAKDPELLQGSFYVLEFLYGGFALNARIGSLKNGQDIQKIQIPGFCEGSFSLRIWPFCLDGLEKATLVAFSLPEKEFNPSLTFHVESEAVTVRNSSQKEPLRIYRIWGQGEPVHVRYPPVQATDPPSPLISQALDPLKLRASSLLRFSTGFFLFLFSLPLFLFLTAIIKGRAFGPILYGLSGLALYTLALLSYRLFAPCILAVSMFWLYRRVPEFPRSLGSSSRLALRWVVLALSLGPYLTMDIPPNSKVSHAHPGRRGKIGDLYLHSPRRAARTIAPKGVLCFPRPEGSSWCSFLVRRGEKKVLFKKVTLPPLLSVALEPRIDKLVLFKQDLLFLRITVENPLSKPWKGKFSLKVKGPLKGSANFPPFVEIAPGAKLSFRLSLKGIEAGEGHLEILWEGESSGRKLLRAVVLPVGCSFHKVWNSHCRKGGSREDYQIILPGKSLYKGTRLSVTVYPGPLSHFLAVLESAEEAPLSEEEIVLLKGYASCMALLYEMKTRQELSERGHILDELSSSLSEIFKLQRSDGGFRSSLKENLLSFTASCALLLKEVELLWNFRFPATKRALDFLKSHMRADGSFRSTQLSAPLSKEDLLQTGLICSVLREEAPQLSVKLLFHKLLETNDPEIASACLASLLKSSFPLGEVLKERLKFVIDQLKLPPRGSLELGRAFLAYALAEAQVVPEICAKALASLLLLRKGPWGFRRPEATLLCLKTILMSSRAGPRLTENVFEFVMNSHPQRTEVFYKSMPDVPREILLTNSLRIGRNLLEVYAKGSVFTPYQVQFSYTLPWQSLSREEQDLLLMVDLPKERVTLGEVFPVSLTFLAKKGAPSFSIFKFQLPSHLQLESVPLPLKPIKESPQIFALSPSFLEAKGDPAQAITLQIRVKAVAEGRTKLGSAQILDPELCLGLEKLPTLIIEGR